MACRPLGFPETLSWFHKIKIIFTILRGYRPFHCVDTCTDGAQTKVGKIAGALAQSKVVAPKIAVIVFFNTRYCNLKWKILKNFKKPVSLQNVLDDKVKIIHLVTPWVPVFLIFCVTKQKLCICKHFFVLEKVLVQLSCELN